jgi:hypothetical protein
MLGGGSQTYYFKEGDAFLEMLRDDPYMDTVREWIRGVLKGACADRPDSVNGSFAHDYGTGSGNPDYLAAGRDALYAGALYAPPIGPITGAVKAGLNVGLPLAGATKTSAVLGRYQGTWQTKNVDYDSCRATIAFHVDDFWNAPSLTGFLGGGLLPESPLGEKGPLGGKINLNFDWEETLDF